MAREAARRTGRTPIHDAHRGRLNVRGKDPAFEYYIVNDVGSRVDEMKEAGWEVVTEDTVKIGDRRLGIPLSEGSAKTVSVGGGVTGVLMKIKREFWEEDRDAKNSKARQAVEGALSDAKKSGDYGDIKQS